MAKSYEELKNEISAITNEVEDGANTANRIGGAMADIADFAKESLESQEERINEETDIKISGLVVQETGDGERVVMSQKAVTEKLSELESKVEDGRLQRFSLIGNGEVQQYITMASGKIEPTQTILTIYLSEIKVSEAYTNAPAVYCRIYGDNGNRLLNQPLPYNKTVIAIPDGGATFSVDFFASVVGGSVVGAEYSVDVRYWLNNSAYDDIAKSADGIDRVEHVAVNSKEEFTPEIVTDYYINIYGAVISSPASNFMVYTKPIALAKGESIMLQSSTQNDVVAAISLTNSEGNSYSCIRKGLSGNKVGVFAFVAPRDCYVALSYMNVNSKIYKMGQSALSDIAFGGNYLDIAGLNDAKKLSPSFTEYKYIHVNGNISDSGSNPMRMTEPIKMNAGDIILMGASTLNNVVAAISLTDSAGNVIKPLIPGAPTHEIYRYWAENDCYVVLSYCTDNVDVRILRNTPFKSIVGINEWAGLNFGVDGDSITVGNQWSYIVYQNLQFATHHNVALGSATFSDKALTMDGVTYTPQDYDSADYVGMSNGWQATTDATEMQKRANNCSRVHIQKFIAEVNAGQYPAPDLFVFAMGTNDGEIGSLEDALDGDNIESMSESTRRTMLGGARYAIQKIMQTYPNSRIFVSVPIQRADSASNKKTYEKVEALRQLCDALSVKCINTYGECGICEKIETGTGPYLSDGLHPNETGVKLMGAYLTKEIRNNMW